MQKVGIFYGSSTGNTEASAKQMQKSFGVDNAKIFDVANTNAGEVKQFSNLIFGTSTLGIGELQDDFYDFLAQLKEVNMEGKKVALFGYGDQEGYAYSFVDALGEIYFTLQKKGCEMLGKTSTESYHFEESLAEIDKQFVGLVLDEENQYELTDKRIEHWITQLSNEFNQTNTSIDTTA